tara:strand:- start:1958 stop:2503 length:546 start_codon:yes stop_codon:yes gene_type:complete
MKKKFNYILLFLLLSFSYASKITDKTESQIKKYFPNNISIEWSMYKIPKNVKKNIQNKVKQKFFRDEVNLWEITDKDSMKYYAIIDNVIGKTMPITFLTIFNSTPAVEHSSIIKYREPYGGEVGNKKWLNQFIAYTDSSNYKVGRDISGISGATLSVHSVTKGIHKLSLLIHEIIKDSNEK